jgi:hypothetical protein
MSIKIRSSTSFGGEAKPSVPRSKILRHIKEPYRSEKRYFVGKIHGHFSPSFSCFVTTYHCLLPESFCGWIRNDWNSRWGRTTDQKCSQYLERLVRYYSVTVPVNSKQFKIVGLLCFQAPERVHTQRSFARIAVRIPSIKSKTIPKLTYRLTSKTSHLLFRYEKPPLPGFTWLTHAGRSASSTTQLLLPGVLQDSSPHSLLTRDNTWGWLVAIRLEQNRPWRTSSAFLFRCCGNSYSKHNHLFLIASVH